MRQILLDSNAYVAFKRGDEAALQIIRMADRIGFSTVVLGELLAGFSGGDRETINRAELAEFLGSPRVATLPIEDQTAEFYARIYASLRRKGSPIPTNDLWIAATAMQHGFSVFTYDKHFDMIDNLWTGHQAEQFLP